MYSIKMWRPSYNGRARYIFKVKTLSDVASVIVSQTRKVDTVLNLTRKERILLSCKCDALVHKNDKFKKDKQEEEIFFFLLDGIFRRM